MKEQIKNYLKKIGVQVNFTKNLWYLDPYEIMKRFTPDRSPVIFDLGACDGHTALIFKDMYPASTVYSFEPFPDSYALLKKNAATKTGISPHQVALSNYIGKKIFYVNKSKATNSLLPPNKTNSFIDDHSIFENEIEVDTITLDEFCERNKIDKIDILKLDVQGGELMAFQGATQLLKSHKIKLIYSEIWFIEGYKGQPLYHDVASYLATFGYKPFGIYNMHFRKDGHNLWGDAIFYLDEANV